MLYINIEPDDSYKHKKLIDNISELRSTPKEEPPAFTLSNLASLDSDVKKEKKKEKKKDKKKKKKNENNLSSMLDDSYEFNSDIETEEYSSLLDVDNDAIKLLLSDGEDSIADVIIGEGRDYNKYKKSGDKLMEQFGPELTYLYDLLDEVNIFGRELDKQFNFVSGSKARGMSKTSNDLTQNIISNKKTKLDVVKEIASIKKTIEDLKLKHENAVAKRAGGESSDLSNEASAAMFMSNIMKVGRNNFVEALENNDEQYNYDMDKALNALSSEHDNDWEEDGQSNKSKFYDGFYDEDEIDEIDELIDSRLDKEDFASRTASGDKYIMYENQQPSIMIKKCIDTGDWSFIAVNKDKQEIAGYPLPDKETLGRMKFSADGNIATDKYGRTYRVIEYYSDDIV
jgi:hypothetical protein